MLLNQYINGHDDDVALKCKDGSMTYRALLSAVENLASWITNHNAKRVGIAFDNSFAWVIADLACQQANVCCVPVPLFFSASQQEHVLNESQCHFLLTNCGGELSEWSESPTVIDSEYDIVAHPLKHDSRVYTPVGTNKITFTSGSTGSPKGVCLSTESQWKVAHSIERAVQPEIVNHLCLLPLSTLLENIAGVYAPLYHGGTVYLATASERGFQGSKLVNPNALLSLIDRVQPTSVILVPDLLMVLVQACNQGWTPPSSLMFIAVGGAHVAPTLLAQAQAKGLPVFEGYGLSEAVSVSTLNTPTCNTMGSAGKTLGHNQLHIEEGEIVVTGNHFLGYLNQPSSFYPNQVRTGDLGVFSDNTLTLNGRIKNIMVNSFGRNVSPEWIESLLLGTGLFRQALVYCEAKPYCVALLVPASNTISNTQIQSTVALINKQLPDYAQVVNFANIGLCTPENQLLTPTGKLKRDAIITRYATDLDMLYQSQDQHQQCVQSTTAFSSQFVIKE